MKKILVFVVLIFLVISSNAKEFYLKNAYVEYNINPDGIINVKQEIDYHLEGCFKELYIQKPPSLSIYNAKGSCIGAECTFRVDEPHESISGDRELILALKEGSNCDREVKAVFEYDIKVLRKNKDHVQFFYKLWGSGWSKDVQLKAKVTLPGESKDVIYYIHPRYIDYKINAEGNTIEIEGHQPSETFLEINLLMPVEWFNKNAYYIETSNKTKEEIAEIEKEDERKEKEEELIEKILLALYLISFLLPPLLFVIIYYIYGRELSKEKVGYLNEYEYYPPYEMSAAEASFYLEGNIGNNALPATIMMLAYKGYVDIKEDKKKKDVLIKIREPKFKKKLSWDEEEVLKLLKKNAKDGIVSIKEFKEKNTYNKEFALWYKDWVKEIKEKKIKKDLDTTGTKIYNIIAFIGFGISFIMPFLVFQGMEYALLLVLASVKPSLLGRWTKEGRIKNLRWNAFKRYLEDYTLLKKKPPSSVELWDLFMVYATAFGVAKKVLKAMKTIPMYEELKKTRRIAVYTAISSPVFVSAFRSVSRSTSSGGSSFGGMGGGFGGGGGGAR